MARKHKTRAIECAEITGHDYLARVVIAVNDDPKTARPYHVRRIWKDGAGDTSTHAEYVSARAAAEATLSAAADEGASFHPIAAIAVAA